MLFLFKNQLRTTKQAHGYTGSYNNSALLNQLDNANIKDENMDTSYTNLMPPPVINYNAVHESKTTNDEYILPSTGNASGVKTPTSHLYEKFKNGMDFQFSEPVRDEQTGLFVIKLAFTDGVMFEGYGRNKKLAKHHACAVALEGRLNMGPFDLPEGCGFSQSSSSLKPSDKALRNQINAMVGKAKNESFPSPSKDPMYIDPGRIVARVNELHPGIMTSLVSTQDEGKQPLYHCSIKINGNEFLGHGRAKKQAKHDMCSKILRDLHGYNLKPPRAGQDIFCSEDIQTRGRVADKIQDAIVMKFNELCANGVDAVTFFNRFDK